MSKKKLIALVLILSLVCTLLVACVTKEKAGETATQPKPEQQEEEKAPAPAEKDADVPNLNKSGYPIVEDQIKLTALFYYGATADEDVQDNPFVKRMEEITNIKIEFQCVPDSLLAERKTAALLGGDLPDILIVNLHDEDEVYKDAFYPLNDLIEKYNPNLKKLIKERPLIEIHSTTSDGNIYSFPYIYMLPTNESIPWVNRQWLDNLNLPMPEKVEDYCDVLRAFKTKDPNGNQQADEYAYSGFGFTNIFMNAVGIPSSPYRPLFMYPGETTVNWAHSQENLKYALELINRLYKEGIIDDTAIVLPGMENYSDYHSTWTEDLHNDLIGSWWGFGQNLQEEQVDYYDVLPLQLSAINSKKVAVEPPYLYTGKIQITKKCKYPEAVARWVDLLYLPYDEAVRGISGISLRMGIQGEAWEFTNPEKTTYKVIETGDPELDNAPKTIGNWGQFACYADVKGAPENNPRRVKHVEGSTKEYLPYFVPIYPQCRLIQEEREALSEVYDRCVGYSYEMIIKFAKGEEPLSNWDNYVSELNKMGLDDVLAIHQTALDRYVAKGYKGSK